MQRFRKQRLLTIAGHDPSGGAGITADLRLWHLLNVVGESILSCYTIQNEEECVKIIPVSEEDIIQQYDCLTKEIHYPFIKIGMFKDLSTLDSVLEHIRSKDELITIVWDPIIVTSSGLNTFDDLSYLPNVLAKVDYITPNISEWEIIRSYISAEFKLVCIVKGYNAFDNIYEDNDITFCDAAIDSNLSEIEFSKFVGPCGDRHGSGCIYSSSFTYRLTKTDEMYKYLNFAQKITRQYKRYGWEGINEEKEEDCN